MTLAEQYLIDITGVGLHQHEAGILNYYREHQLITHIISDNPDETFIIFVDTSGIIESEGGVFAFGVNRKVDFTVLIKRIGQ